MSPTRVSNKSATYHGLLLVDKPQGMTSHDVVQKVRRLTQQRQVGHVGTLDPLATGLLALCLGKGGKIARFLTDYDKTYEAQLRLGICSKTYDAEGVSSEQIQDAAVPNISRSELDAAISNFLGTIEQRAPIYSAIKVDGQPLYRSARNGDVVEAPVRKVTIRNIKVDKFELPLVDFTVECGKGTYIRSLANDIGVALGCGAYLSRLSRTAIGKLSLADAIPLDDLERIVTDGELDSHVISPERALELPALIVTDTFASRIINGLRPDPADIESVRGDFVAGEYVSLMSSARTLLAVGVSEVDSNEISVTTIRPIYKHLRVM
jgi:tRNA pseudouridine55 synthase